MTQKPFPPPYDILIELLVGARQTAGLTQEALADRLQIGQSAVSKVERGVQRLDLVELRLWLRAIGSPTLPSFVTAFDDRLRVQKVSEDEWPPSRRRSKSKSTTYRAVRKAK